MSKGWVDNTTHYAFPPKGQDQDELMPICGTIQYDEGNKHFSVGNNDIEEDAYAISDVTCRRCLKLVKKFRPASFDRYYEKFGNREGY